MQRFAFLVVFLIFGVAANGQGLKIDLKLTQAAGQKVYLAHYFLENIYLDDSVMLDAGGVGVFKRDTLLPQGLYKIYKDKDNHFDFLLGADQQFRMEGSAYTLEKVKAEGAIETEEFISYVFFLKNLQDKASKIRKRKETATPGELQKIQLEVNSINQELHAYWFKTREKYPDLFISKFLLANYVPELDVSKLPAEIAQNDSLLLLARFNFQKEHFWDYLDYTDERFLYTPLLKPKLETWFTKVLYQYYDSVRPAVYGFIEDVRPSKKVFQFAVSWFLNSTINSNVLGMDALFVDLAKSYYLNGEAYWAGEETMKTIRENVLFIEPNLLGKTAPDLTLETVDGEYVNLHKIKSKLTAVLIYEPNCSHCKEFVPQFHDEIFKVYKEKGLKVYAIYSMDNREEWVDFLEKHQLYDWINVWDPNHLSRFKISYDARKTPGIYILDENKKIVAKKLAVDQLKQLMNDLL